MSSDQVAQDQLRAFVERIERLHEERKAIADDIKEMPRRRATASTPKS